MQGQIDGVASTKLCRDSGIQVHRSPQNSGAYGTTQQEGAADHGIRTSCLLAHGRGHTHAGRSDFSWQSGSHGQHPG